MVHRFRFPTLLALAAALIALGIVSSGGSVDAAGSSRTDVIIGFTQQPGPAEQALVRQAGGTIKYTYHLVPAIAAALPEAAIAGLQANPNVTAVDPDGEVHIIDHPTGDPELDNAWGVAHIGAGAVHASGNKGTGVKVAVIDTGADYNHPDLNDNFDLSSTDRCTGGLGHDFVNNDTDPMDDHGHGTHTAGTVAAEDDNDGVVGVAPEACLYALKVLNASGSGSWSGIMAALQWAVDNRIQVTNNSYGSSRNPGAIVEAAFDNAAAAGVLNVASAGNSGNCGGKGNNVGYPARFASTIAVAATDKNDARPCFSSTGPDVELAAPGVAVNSTVPKPGEDGDGCALCDESGYKLLNGTSMASPHVAGTAALAIAAGIADVRTQLRTTADDLGDPGRDNKYGYGLVNAAGAATPAGPPAPDTTPPVLVTATVVSTSLVLAYDEALDTGSVPVTDRFTIGTNGDPQSVTAVGVSGTDVALTLLPGVAAGDTVTVSYTAGANPIQDTAENDAANLMNHPVTNNTPAAGGTVSVSSISYATEGGKNKDKHLLITVALDQAVSGTSVSITLTRDLGGSWSGTGTTAESGTVTFSLKNAKTGCYTTTVTDVTADGLTWDPDDPANVSDPPFCK